LKNKVAKAQLPKRNCQSAIDQLRAVCSSRIYAAFTVSTVKKTSVAWRRLKVARRGELMLAFVDLFARPTR
jgi:hypothetical protein